MPKYFFLAALNLNLIKIPICWIIYNFCLNKLEHYLICGTVVHLKKSSFLIMLKEKHCLENSLEGAHTHIYTYTCWCQYWGKH